MKHLTKEQRYVIQSLLKKGVNMTEIAQELSVNKSTISREVKRNSSKRGKYNAEMAHIYAQERKEHFAIRRWQFYKVFPTGRVNFIQTDGGLDQCFLLPN